MSVAVDYYLGAGERAARVGRPEPALRAVGARCAEPAVPRGRPERRPECRPERQWRQGSVAVLRAPAGSEVAPPLRLTRRGVAVLALLVAAAGGLLVWLAAISAPGSSPRPAMPATVTVHAGDTLWSIASRYAGDGDPRAVVAAIEARNHLVDARVLPGQVLRLR